MLPRLHVVLRQHVFYVFNGEPQHSKLTRPAQSVTGVRPNRDIHHCHFCQLLDATLYDIFGKLATNQETRVRPPCRMHCRFLGQIAEDRNVRRTSAFITFGRSASFGQIVHGSVNLLIHFYEGKVGIRTEVEAQADDAPSRVLLSMSFSFATWMSRRRRGFTTVSSNSRARGILRRHLHCNFRDGNIGQQGYRQGE